MTAPSRLSVRSRRLISAALAALGACTGVAGCNALLDIGAGTVAPRDASTPIDPPTPPEASTDAAVDAADAAPRGCDPITLALGGTRACGTACPPARDLENPEAAGGPLTILRADRERLYVGAGRFVYAVRPASFESQRVNLRSPVTHELAAAAGATFSLSNGGVGSTVVVRGDSCDGGYFVEAFQDAGVQVPPGLCNYHQYPDIHYTRPMGEVVATSALSAWFRSNAADSGLQVVEYKVLGPEFTVSLGGGPPGRRFQLPAGGTSLAVRGPHIVYGYDGGAGAIDLIAEAGAPLLEDAGSVVDVAATCSHAYLAESGRIVRVPFASAPDGGPRAVLALPTGEPFSGDMAIDATTLWYVAGSTLYAVPLVAFESPSGVVQPSAILTIGAVPGGTTNPSVAVTDDYVAVLGGVVVRVWKKAP